VPSFNGWMCTFQDIIDLLEISPSIAVFWVFSILTRRFLVVALPSEKQARFLSLPTSLSLTLLAGGATSFPIRSNPSESTSNQRPRYYDRHPRCPPFLDGHVYQLDRHAPETPNQSKNAQYVERSSTLVSNCAATTTTILGESTISRRTGSDRRGRSQSTQGGELYS
jgi:hypothetical protein